MSMRRVTSSNTDRIIQKQKKSWLIGTIFIAISCIMLLLTTAMCFAYKINGFAIVLLILFILDIIATVFFIHTYKTRSDREWIIAYVEEKHLASSPEGLRLLTQVDVVNDDNFIIDKIINITTTEWSTTRLLIDNQNKKFILQKRKTCSKTYSFSDLISYEIYENGKSQVQGRAGSALIGGAFFGLGGLIVGSSRSRNIIEKCNQLKLIIHLNDFECPEIVFTYADNADWDKNGAAYKRLKDNIQSVCSMLEYILNQKTLEQSSKVGLAEQSPIHTSTKEQLQELKELLDSGLITQEDYEQKKKQLLGL